MSQIETVEMECRYCGERFSEPKRRKQRCYCPPHRHARYRMAVLSADGGRAPRVRRPEPAFEEDRAPNWVECERCGDVFSAFGLGYHRQVCSPPEFREPPAVAKVPPPTHCPRCSARLLGNHGERYCFVHGTFDHIPRPPGPDDLVAEAARRHLAGNPLGEGRHKSNRAHVRRVARDYAERDKWACKSANDVDNALHDR